MALRVFTCLVLVALGAGAAGKQPPPVPLRDLKPAFVRGGGGAVLRSRTPGKRAILVAGERHRGLAWRGGGSAGFDLGGAFAKFTARVAVVDGGKAPLQFYVRADGKTRFATPPLFPGAEPLAIEASVSGAQRVTLEIRGPGGAYGAWLGGRLHGAPGADLGDFRAESAPFSPQAYPHKLRKAINASIDKAVLYLRTHQQSDGTWASNRHATGTTALVALALLKADVPRDDPVLVRAFAYLNRQPIRNTYAAAVRLMALEAKWFPKGANPDAARDTISDADRDRIERLAEWLMDKQGAGYSKAQRPFHPVWRYPHGGYDLSCTQYALFGLAAADRCGVNTRKVWLPCLRFLLGAQEEEGPEVTVSRFFRDGKYERRQVEEAEARGFGYVLDRPPTGSMTSAGLCAMILCRNALSRSRTFRQSYRKKTERAIRDALAWLEEHYTIDENVFAGRAWLNYYRFNLERAGVLLDQRYVGTRDWYEDGARALLAGQKPGGAFGGTIDTAFALLFLKRATVAPTTRSR